MKGAAEPAFRFVANLAGDRGDGERRSILLYLPQVSIARPLAIVVGCTLGAAIGTMLCVFFGFGPDVAVLAAPVALLH
ncbi:MAG TPA: hypothetical protein VMU81_28255 [Acetobacteraceae bacterium]|nr:hypothetical protein [Acetobacteraceae bacterium]